MTTKPILETNAAPKPKELPGLQALRAAYPDKYTDWKDDELMTALRTKHPEYENLSDEDIDLSLKHTLDAPFDADSDAYDYKSAREAGLEADKEGHWPSRNPETGMLLKGRNHPTFGETIKAEADEGYSIKKRDGRYYSVKSISGADVLRKLKPNQYDDWTDDEIYASIRESMPNTNQLDDAQLDYALKGKIAQDSQAMMKELEQPVHPFEELKEGWLSERILEKAPFIGDAYKGLTDVAAQNAYYRMKKGNYEEHNKAGAHYFESDPSDLVQSTSAIKYSAKQDNKIIEKAMEKALFDLRPKTVLAGIANGVSALPKWMMEFAMTAGIYKIGNLAVRGAMRGLIGEYAKTEAGRTLLKTMGWVGGSAFRSTLGLPTQTFQKAAARQWESAIGMRNEEKPLTSLLKAWGSTTIEAFSELGGGPIGKGTTKMITKLLGTKFGSRWLPTLEKAMIKKGMSKKGFWSKAITKGGYSDLLSEWGEEELGVLLRGLTGVTDTEGDIFTRTYKDVTESLKYDSIVPTIGTLAFPGAIKGVATSIDRYRAKGEAIREMRNTGATEEEINAIFYPKRKSRADGDITPPSQETSQVSDGTPALDKPGAAETTEEAVPEQVATEEQIVAHKPAMDEISALETAEDLDVWLDNKVKRDYGGSWDDFQESEEYLVVGPIADKMYQELLGVDETEGEDPIIDEAIVPEAPVAEADPNIVDPVLPEEGMQEPLVPGAEQEIAPEVGPVPLESDMEDFQAEVEAESQEINKLQTSDDIDNWYEQMVTLHGSVEEFESSELFNAIGEQFLDKLDEVEQTEAAAYEKARESGTGEIEALESADDATLESIEDILSNAVPEVGPVAESEVSTEEIEPIAAESEATVTEEGGVEDTVLPGDKFPKITPKEEKPQLSGKERKAAREKEEKAIADKEAEELVENFAPGVELSAEKPVKKAKVSTYRQIVLSEGGLKAEGDLAGEVKRDGKGIIRKAGKTVDRMVERLQEMGYPIEDHADLLNKISSREEAPPLSDQEVEAFQEREEKKKLESVPVEIIEAVAEEEKTETEILQGQAKIPKGKISRGDKNIGIQEVIDKKTAQRNTILKEIKAIERAVKAKLESPGAEAKIKKLQKQSDELGLTIDNLKNQQGLFDNAAPEEPTLFREKIVDNATESQLAEIKKLLDYLLGKGNYDLEMVETILENAKAIGAQKGRLIQIVDGKAEQVDTAMHEAVHLARQTLFTDKENSKLDKLLQKAEMTEEDFAEGIVEYAKTKDIKIEKGDKSVWNEIKSFIRKFITKVKKAFGPTNTMDKINSVYDQILSGELSSRTATEAKRASQAFREGKEESKKEPKKKTAYQRGVEAERERQREKAKKVLKTWKDKNATEEEKRDILQKYVDLFVPPQYQKFFFTRIRKTSTIKQLTSAINSADKWAVKGRKTAKANLDAELDKKTKAEKNRKSQIDKVKDDAAAKIKEIKRSFLDKTRTIDEIRKLLQDYTEAFVPVHLQGKMNTKIRTVKTKTQLLHAIDSADKWAAHARKIGIRVKLRKLLKDIEPKRVSGRPRARIELSAYKRLRAYRRFINEHKDDKRDDVRRYLKQNGWDFEVFMQGMNNMNEHEITVLYEELRSLRDNGKTLHKMEKEAREAEREDNVLTALEAMGVLADFDPSDGGLIDAENFTKDRNKASAFIEQLVNANLSWDNFVEKLHGSGAGAKFTGKLFALTRSVQNSTTAQMASEHEKMEYVRAAAAKIFGETDLKKMSDLLNQMSNEKIDVGNHKSVPEEMRKDNLVLTKMQLIKLFNYAKDSAAKKKLREQGWTAEYQRAGYQLLNEQDRAWADWLENFYADYYHTINETYEKIYGVPLGHNWSYTPWHIEKEDLDIAYMLMPQFQKESVNNRHMKMRKGEGGKLKYTDANRDLIDYISQMEHFRNWAETIMTLRGIFKDTRVRNTVLAKFGKDMLKRIDWSLDNFERGGATKAKSNRMADWLRNNFTTSILGMKPSIGLKQIPSILAFATEMPTGALMRGVADFWNNKEMTPLQKYRWLRENSPDLRVRWDEGFSRDIKFAVQKKKSASKQIAENHNLKFWYFLNISIGDKLATVQGVWAAYQHGLNEGLGQEEALGHAVSVMNRTQPTHGIETLAPLQADGSFMKLMTMFQNQPNKYFRIQTEAWRTLFGKGRGTRAEATKNILLVHIILPTLFQFIADGFRWDDERQLRAAVLGPMNRLLAAGNFLDATVGYVQHKLAGDRGYKYQATPVFSSVDDFQKAIDGIFAEDVDKMIKYFTLAAGKIFGVPTPALIQAMEADVPKELLFSKYALEADDESRDLIGDLYRGKSPKTIARNELNVRTIQ